MIKISFAVQIQGEMVIIPTKGDYHEDDDEFVAYSEKGRKSGFLSYYMRSIGL